MALVELGPGQTPGPALPTRPPWPPPDTVPTHSANHASKMSNTHTCSGEDRKAVLAESKQAGLGSPSLSPAGGTGISEPGPPAASLPSDPLGLVCQNGEST